MILCINQHTILFASLQSRAPKQSRAPEGKPAPKRECVGIVKWNWNNQETFMRRRSLSLIMAMNSLLVGLPRVFWIV